MIKKVFTVLLGLLVAGTMISVAYGQQPDDPACPDGHATDDRCPGSGGYGDRSQDDYGSCRYGHPAHYGPGHALWSDDGPRPDHGRTAVAGQRHGQRPAGRGCRPCRRLSAQQRSVRL